MSARTGGKPLSLLERLGLRLGRTLDKRLTPLGGFMRLVATAG